MKSENEWKTKLVGEAKKMGWFARRIEDSFGVGFPDMIMRPPGYPIFVIEAKLAPLGSFAPSPRQYIDLIALHDPPIAFGLVLGINEDEYGGAVFSFSAPLKKVFKKSNTTHHHVNFHRGLITAYDIMKREAQ